MMYLLNWISYSIAGIPRDIVLAFVDASSFIMSKPMLLFACYATTEIIYDILVFFLMAFLVHIIDRVYIRAGAKRSAHPPEALQPPAAVME